MRTYRKTFKVSETFPVELYEEWSVTERGIVCEHWKVVDARRQQFTAEIREYFPAAEQ